MLASAFALFLALQTKDTTKAVVPPDSYADAATADLVTRARAARERNERLVTSYTATAKQRIGVGIRALSRDRMLYRNETVARIKWRRDSASTVEVVGAREGIPVVNRGDQLPEDLDFGVRDLVINPAEDVLRFIGGDDDEGFVYPLRQGGEIDYKFALGDTTTITLQNGKRIQLLALRIIPRRADWRLMSGTLWYDAETLGLVQAVFKPARPFELQRDLSPEDKEDVPEVGERDRGGQVPHAGVRALRVALVDAALHGARRVGLDGFLAQRADPVRADLRGLRGRGRHASRFEQQVHSGGIVPPVSRSRRGHDDHGPRSPEADRRQHPTRRCGPASIR